MISGSKKSLCPFGGGLRADGPRRDQDRTSEVGEGPVRNEVGRSLNIITPYIVSNTRRIGHASKRRELCWNGGCVINATDFKCSDKKGSPHTPTEA